MRIRMMLAALALSTLAGAGCGSDEPEVEFQPGELNVMRLQQAARAAGFKLDRVEAEIPSARRPGVKFTDQAWDDSLLTALRERYNLAGLIDSAAGEWDAQLLLKHWLHQRIENGTPDMDAANAIEILDAAAAGHKFWCSYFAISYVQCAQALGWQARKISLDHLHEPGGVGSRHHGAAEVWSNQWRKWVYIDPQSDLHYEKNGVPLSAWEIRSEWLADSGVAVAHVVGVPPDTVCKNPAIVWWDLKDEDETALFFWLIYHDSYCTWDSTSPSPFYTPADSFTRGKTWYQGGDSLYLHTGYRMNLFEPVEDMEKLYWTVGVVEAQIIGVERGRLRLALDTWLPDFSRFEASVNGGEWREVAAPDSLAWELGMGANGLSLRAVNQAGVSGPRTTLVVN